MNTENTKKLYKKYPKIFTQKDLPMTQTCMCFGFDCGDGWFWLIDQLCDCIQSYIDSNNIYQIEATQVKEKFGTLNFYYHGGDNTISGMIWLAESMSGSICEMCGTTVNVSQTKGWIKTICPYCLFDEGNKK